MQIMTDKGLVNRDTSARTHIYAAHPKKETTTGHLLQKFLKTAYNGSVSKLVMQALGNHETSADELAEIKQLIKDIEKSNDV
jgi:predicted transcriptional regulator